MTPFKLFTLGLLGLSITLAQPALAQTSGGSADGRGGASDSGRDNGDAIPRFPSRGGADPATVPVQRVGTHNTTTAGGPISEEELELTCGAGGWLETWLEDANGNPIEGTYEYYCLDE